MRATRLIAVLATTLAVHVAPCAAQTTSETAAATEAPASTPIEPSLLAELRKGGYLLFFRHARTPNYADPDDSTLDNCATQRNLSKDGIAQAKAMGEAFRDLEIPLGIVRASPYCRCMDTAWLAFGRDERDMSLRLTGENPETHPDEAKRWKHMRNIAKILPLPGTNSVYVSHGTAGEVFGAGYLKEGEAVIVKPDGAGGWKLISRVESEQWRVGP
jgi:broad specificity phosphatase PhoE